MTSMNLQKIKKQVEFYFSDANYRVDKFMRAQALLNDGYIPISVLLTFRRLKELNATLDDVKEAVTGSAITELREDMIKKRETEEFLKYSMKKDIDKQVVYISGFNKEMTLEDVTDVLSKYTEPLLIRMRRDKAKQFSGSVFVELKSEDDAKRLIKEKISLDGSGDDASKRFKIDSCLEMMSKLEFMKNRESLKAKKDEKRVREEFIAEAAPKLYRLETDADISIDAIKKRISDVAFVDLKAKIVRMKHIPDFETREFPSKDGKIILTKMNEDESVEYCKKVPIRVKDKGRKRNKGL